MFRHLVVWGLLVSAASSQELKARADTPAVPQTARQALIEMLTSSNEKKVERHLPEALLTRLNSMKPKDAKASKSSQKAILDPQQFQIFESGPVFLVYMPPKAEQRVEVLVDRDEPTAGGNDFAFSFRVTREGKEVASAIVPKLLAQMKQEGGTWRLAQLGFSVQMQLDDGDKLDELMRSAMSAMATAAAKPSETTAAPAEKKRQGGDEWVPAKPAK